MTCPSAPERPAWRQAIERLAQGRVLRRLAWPTVLLLPILALVLWGYGVGPDDITRWGQAGLAWLRERPLWLLLAIVVLPGLPIPAAPLLILAGVILTPRFGAIGAVLLAWLAIACNMTWTYWVAAGAARHLVDRLLRQIDVGLPTLSGQGALRICVLVRVTPGIPLFLQNLSLGFFRVPFRVYLPVSVSIQAFYVTGFVVFGESLQFGSARLALTAIALVVIALVVTHFVRERLIRRGAPQ